MNLNSGVNILPSSCYTCKVLSPAHFLNGQRARVCSSSPFYASLWWLNDQDRSLAVASYIKCEVEDPNCLETKWGSLGLLNGEFEKG